MTFLSDGINFFTHDEIDTFLTLKAHFSLKCIQNKLIEKNLKISKNWFKNLLKYQLAYQT